VKGQGRPLSLLVTLLAGLALSACGTTTSGLDVRYPEAGVNQSLLASAPPRRVEISPVADRRLDTARIGSKPKDGGAIVTSRPVTEIVGEALALEVRKNGHTVVSDKKDVVLAGAVEEFRLDVVSGYSSTQYVGRVVIAVTLVDGRSGDQLLTRRYVGISRRQIDKGSDKDWRDVMDVALARSMHDLATDPELAAVLTRLLTAFNP
jgi:uncharacterized lipoprotein YajG